MLAAALRLWHTGICVNIQRVAHVLETLTLLLSAAVVVLYNLLLKVVSDRE
jgi:hypothetical protein